MSLNSQTFPGGGKHVEEIKHVVLRASGEAAGGCEYVPRVYFEAKIDLNDVRSGFRETCALYEMVDIDSMEGDLLWTRDMVRPIDPTRVESGMPRSGRLRDVPSYVDANYLSRMNSLFFTYLMRYFHVNVYRNPSLNVYSHPGESEEDFIARCADLLDEPFRTDLHELQQVFVRKLDQVRERCLRDYDPAGEFEALKSVSHWRSKVHESSSMISDLFLQPDLRPGGKETRSVQLSPEQGDTELGSKLGSLEAEAGQAISQLLARYTSMVHAIDEYTIHPSFKDIHLVRSYILWVPEGRRS